MKLTDSEARMLREQFWQNPGAIPQATELLLAAKEKAARIAEDVDSRRSSLTVGEYAMVHGTAIECARVIRLHDFGDLFEGKS